MKQIFFALSLFLFIVLTASFSTERRRKSRTRVPPAFTILGDAGSTGTRLFFFPLVNSKLGNMKCKLKDAEFFTRLSDNAFLHLSELPGVSETDLKNSALYSPLAGRLGDALEANDVEGYAEAIKKIIAKFEAGVDSCNPALTKDQKHYDLMIFSTAGSRLILNRMNPTALANAMAFQNTAFAASLTTKFPANTFNQIVLKVISGRMEGVLGFASLKRTFIQEKANEPWKKIKKAPAQDLLYYEVGGASSQIVWVQPSTSKFLQKAKTGKGVVNFNGFPEKAKLPASIYSRSFLGNGGEETLKESLNKMKECVTKDLNKRLFCLKLAIESNLVTSGKDETTSGNHYSLHWASIVGKLKRSFFNGDSNKKYFLLNSKSISGSYAKRFPKARATPFSQMFSRWISENCNSDKCTLVFPNREAFRKDIFATVKNASDALQIGPDGKLDIKIQKHFANQGLAIGLQLVSILDHLNWPGEIVVYNFGEWTDGAEFLLNQNVDPSTFDLYTAKQTNDVENKVLNLAPRK